MKTKYIFFAASLAVQLTCLLLFAPYAAFAEEPAQGGQSLEQAASDPTASLMSVQIQDIYAGSYHNLDDESGNTILLRSAVPFTHGPIETYRQGNAPHRHRQPVGKEWPERRGPV